MSLLIFLSGGVVVGGGGGGVACQLFLNIDHVFAVKSTITGQ